jgi:CheY-like chemotaxis protein
MACKVLVVDDERFIVDLIADVLEDEGFVVTRAYDGLQATRAINRHLPNLVIADIMMPKMDGITLAHSLRNREEPIPVILMSASRRETPEVDAPFLAKPFDIDDVVALAHKMTDDLIPGPSTSRSETTDKRRLRQMSAGG